VTITARRLLPRRGPHSDTDDLGRPEVDVAIVAESTYPYLKGGVSAVMQDILVHNPDVTFGIIHIAWDSDSPSTPLYEMPPNVLWVHVLYLSMNEHWDDFRHLRPADLGMSSRDRLELADRVFDALAALLDGDVDALWELYDEGMNPRTRSYPLWALLGSIEFMTATQRRLTALELSLTDTFWLLRDFFSLACAVLGADFPRARVYHAHTTGYAGLIAAAAARQNRGRFLLTEHNLYVRDTVNTLLDRNMNLPVAAGDWRDPATAARDRAWMAWWIEMGRFCYPSAGAITYLYPSAITEAADLGAPVQDAIIVPNGMVVPEFDDVYATRQAATREIVASGPEHTWRLVFIARVVPIKGLLDFISTIDLLVRRGVTNFHLDVLGPTDHVPAYYEQCVEQVRELGVADYLTFHGTVNVRSMLGQFDLLVLPSYNEGQPIVVLEAMAAGIPVVGSDVGGMAQLVADPLTTSEGRTWDECGVLLDAGDWVAMADRIQELLSDAARYERLCQNARGRVVDFFQLEDAMRAYNSLYHELGAQADHDRGIAGRVPAAVTTRTGGRRADVSGRSHLARRP
jgi:polysaccharide biosynthesis protein PelF